MVKFQTPSTLEVRKCERSSSSIRCTFLVIFWGRTPDRGRGLAPTAHSGGWGTVGVCGLNDAFSDIGLKYITKMCFRTSNFQNFLGEGLRRISAVRKLLVCPIFLYCSDVQQGQWSENLRRYRLRKSSFEIQYSPTIWMTKNFEVN